MTSRSIHHALAIVATAVLAACGGGGGGGGGDGNTTAGPGTSAAPSITGQPSAAAVTSGQTATFSVAATGSGSLTYQWQKNGVDIPGATGASYTTPATTAGDNGAVYSVKVGNANGTTTSTAAALTVNAAAGGATIQATQQSANELVAAVNSGVDTLRQADAARRFVPGGVRALLLPGGSTQTFSEPCTTGSMDISANIDDSAGRPISATVTFNNCRFLVAGADSFVTGSGAMTFTSWTNQENFAFTLAYNISYSFNYGTQVEQGTLNSSESCTVVGGATNCTYKDGNNQIRSVSLTNNGTVTTVNDAFIDTPTIDCDYNGWVYDSATGRATSGSVTVTDGQGNRAVITVTATGYQAVITVNGTTSTWNVAFGG